MADGFIRLPGDSTGKSLDTQVISTGNAATTEPVHREIIVVGDRDGGDAFAVVTSSAGLMVTISSGIVTLSSAPGFNIPIVSASSGFVQVYQTTAPWSVVSASSGFVQVYQTTSPWAVVSASSGSVQVTQSTTPWAVVNASSGASQAILVAAASSGIPPGLSVVYTITTGNTPTANVKGTPGSLWGYSIYNTTATPRFVKFYNTTSAPTAGTTANQLVNIMAPGSTGGAGANMMYPINLFFSNGVAYAITANVAATDTGPPGANDVVLNLYYV